MAFDMEKQKALDEKHISDPQPGDVWHDMFAGICMIVSRNGDNLQVTKKKRSVDERHYEFVIDAAEQMTLSEFRDWLSYGSIPGYWANVWPARENSPPNKGAPKRWIQTLTHF